MSQPPPEFAEEFVPDSVIPHQTLPPLRYRDLPEAPHWRKLVGPSIILAGLALGSGEFIFWPYVTYKSGFVFFWACMLGVLTQFFMNLEIERWTLATGESAITGFCRLSRKWAWVMLTMNIVPWIWPGWAMGASTMLSWMLFGVDIKPLEVTAPLSHLSATIPADLQSQLHFDQNHQTLVWKGAQTAEQSLAVKNLDPAPEFQQAAATISDKVRKTGGLKHDALYVPWLAIATLLLVGIVLTSSPVVYNTVEALQSYLVGLIFVIAITLGILIIKPYAVWAMVSGIMNVGGLPPADSGLEFMALLGALAFAGAGGTMNLGQSNFIRDKGYGMGKYIGRITSPLTGNEEPIADVGFHFHHTPENMRRWRDWWRAANIEHFFSFYLTCVVSLMLLALISYSLFYGPDGRLLPGMERFGGGMDFVWGEATLIQSQFSSLWMGSAFRLLFCVMGMALLFTTELGVLDAAARISADIIKINVLRENPRWTLARLYFVILWIEILASVAILATGALVPGFSEPLFLLKTSAAMNGLVMCIYGMLLLYLNLKIMPRSLAITPLRFVAMVWACAFFGYFSIQALQLEVWPMIKSWF
ncbi:MAG: Nramp family divalent metal transporter [Planctomycetota bacterium]